MWMRSFLAMVSARARAIAAPILRDVKKIVGFYPEQM